MNEKKMEKRFCQSCGMPLGDTDEWYGTEKDGSKNPDFCKYCFENGAFTMNCSMDEMIEICIPPMVQAHAEMSEEDARNMMKEFFPSLKRWKQN